jgi:hypothetical protein
MLLAIVRGEKICATVRPLALLLLYLSGNTGDVGERQPAKSGNSLPGPFQRASRASDEYASVLLEEEGNDAAPRSGSQTLPQKENCMGG